ncbi:MAG: hypothetical protein WC457_01300 [Patescibacteria group bacterium]
MSIISQKLFHFAYFPSNMWIKLDNVSEVLPNIYICVIIIVVINNNHCKYMNSAIKARIKHARKNTPMGKKLRTKTWKLNNGRKVQY